MELKTLKDLGIGFEISHYNVVDKNELKAEAVKWVKDIIENGHLCRPKDANAGAKECLKTFFNLTEEDLA